MNSHPATVSNLTSSLYGGSFNPADPENDNDEFRQGFRDAIDGLELTGALMPLAWRRGYWSGRYSIGKLEQSLPNHA